MNRLFFALALTVSLSVGAIAPVSATAQSKKKSGKKTAKAAPTVAAKPAERKPDPELAVLDSLQRADKRYTSIEEALKEPEKVRFLDLHDHQLTSLPVEIDRKSVV